MKLNVINNSKEAEEFFKEYKINGSVKEDIDVSFKTPYDTSSLVFGTLEDLLNCHDLMMQINEEEFFKERKEFFDFGEEIWTFKGKDRTYYLVDEPLCGVLTNIANKMNEYFDLYFKLEEYDVGKENKEKYTFIDATLVPDDEKDVVYDNKDDIPLIDSDDGFLDYPEELYNKVKKNIIFMKVLLSNLKK